VAWPVLANGLVLGVAALATILARGDPDQFRLLVQEDGALEWCTFWAFLLAAGVGVANVSRELRQRRLPWWSAGLALFCFLVAMEEISWGQRLLGYRPPAYFLENNFQQEFNFHNVTPSKLRKLALSGIIAGYGIVLPLLLLIRPLQAWAVRLGVVAPPLALVPSFGVVLVFYRVSTFRFRTEWVELLLGGCFLFAMLAAGALRIGGLRSIELVRAGAVLTASILVLGLGVGSANWSAASRLTPELRELAQRELESLDHDLREIAARQGRAFVTKCGLHHRLYTFVRKRKYDADDLRTLQFASSSGPEVARERIDFFLDPWNSPYWIQDRCSKDRSRRTVFVYSFGPNRRRDSTRWEVAGDDLGSYVAAVENSSFSLRSRSPS